MEVNQRITHRLAVDGAGPSGQAAIGRRTIREASVGATRTTPFLILGAHHSTRHHPEAPAQRAGLEGRGRPHGSRRAPHHEAEAKRKNAAGK